MSKGHPYRASCDSTILTGQELEQSDATSVRSKSISRVWKYRVWLNCAILLCIYSIVIDSYRLEIDPELR